MRTLFYAAWVGACLMTLGCLGSFLYGALALSGRFALAGAVLVIPSAVALGCLGAYTADNGAPKRVQRLSRESRRRLNAERERIAYDAEIARLEREAGLQ